MAGSQGPLCRAVISSPRWTCIFLKADTAVCSRSLLPATSGGRVNASAMVRADVASTLPEVFARHPALRERSRNWSPLSDPVSTSPLIFRQPQPERDGMLMVGDAAGFVDPFVGDGISLALRGGALAAHCLASFFAGETSLPRSGAALWPSLRTIAVARVSRVIDDSPHACPARFDSQTAAVYSGKQLPRSPTTWCARPAERRCGRERPRSCGVIGDACGMR